ncbi:MAG: hypothetical protein LKF82_08710 [Acinetobacter populi]|jgi:hypothetical protein|uniref:hypothetical protein n=1 Tax=Acinetobacter populi TaxID=1582270 RepID=UPI002353DB94|nr:hypothetical protein [Acinetobacter populi]MCH4247904.1 hypothetical protein [Acinetobacter populi]
MISLKCIADILAKYPQAVGWMPLKAIIVDMMVLLNRQDNVLKIVDLSPWNLHQRADIKI